MAPPNPRIPGKQAAGDAREAISGILNGRARLSDGPFYFSEKENQAGELISAYGLPLAALLLESCEPGSDAAGARSAVDLSRFRLSTLKSLGKKLNTSCREERAAGVQFLVNNLDSSDAGRSFGAAFGIIQLRLRNEKLTTRELGLEGVSEKLAAAARRHKTAYYGREDVSFEPFGSVCESITRDLGELGALRLAGNPLCGLVADAIHPINPASGSLRRNSAALLEEIGRSLAPFESDYFRQVEAAAKPLHALVVFLEWFIDRVAESGRGFDGGAGDEISRAPCVFPIAGKLLNLKKQLMRFDSGNEADESWLRGLLECAKTELQYLRGEFDTHFPTHGMDE